MNLDVKFFKLETLTEIYVLSLILISKSHHLGFCLSILEIAK